MLIELVTVLSGILLVISLTVIVLLLFLGILYWGFLGVAKLIEMFHS